MPLPITRQVKRIVIDEFAMLALEHELEVEDISFVDPVIVCYIHQQPHVVLVHRKYFEIFSLDYLLNQGMAGKVYRLPREMVFKLELSITRKGKKNSV